MPHRERRLSHSTAARLRPEDPFAMQLALSRAHSRLVPMRRAESGEYEIEPSARGWYGLPAHCPFPSLGTARALRLLLDLLRGLTALHDTRDATGEHFVHGDVTPSRLRIDSLGVCRLVALTPFHSGSGLDHLSAEDLGYLAPERVWGERVSARADVFSAGVFLWEALARQRLFADGSQATRLRAAAREPLQVPQLPPELAWAIPLKAVATRALSLDPKERFTDCAELSLAISIAVRERLASHAELANFFAKASGVSSAETRIVPNRSASFAKQLPPHSDPQPRRRGSPFALLLAPAAGLFPEELPTPSLPPPSFPPPSFPSLFSDAPPPSMVRAPSMEPAPSEPPPLSAAPPPSVPARLSSPPSLSLAPPASAVPRLSVAPPASVPPLSAPPIGWSTNTWHEPSASPPERPLQLESAARRSRLWLWAALVAVSVALGVGLLLASGSHAPDSRLPTPNAAPERHAASTQPPAQKAEPGPNSTQLPEAQPLGANSAESALQERSPLPKRAAPSKQPRPAQRPRRKDYGI